MNYSFRKIAMFLLPIVLIYIIFSSVIANINVNTPSMEGTILDGSYVIANRLAYVMREPQRGEIIVIEKEDVVQIKRIVGMPGDTIELKKDSADIIINGHVLSEDYVSEGVVSSNDEMFVVPDGCYFVLGDNRPNSIDSRYWEEKYVPKNSIIVKYLGGINN